MSEEFGGGAVVEGFEFLGELAGDADPGPGGEFSEDFEGGGNPVRRFKEESGLGGVEGGLELLSPFTFFHREEAVEGKGRRGKAGGDEGGGDGRWPGKDGEGDSGIACRFQKPMAGVGKAGGSGIGNDGDLFASLRFF